MAAIEDSAPGLYIHYKATLESPKTSARRTEIIMWFLVVCPPTPLSRTGKDFAIMLEYKHSLYWKENYKCWDVDQKEKYVLIYMCDIMFNIVFNMCDIEPFHAKYMGYRLKVLADQYPFYSEF